MDLIDRLLETDHWATARLLELSQGLTDAQVDQQFDIGHGTLRETFEHMLYAMDFWTVNMAGQPIPWEPVDRHSIAELRERHERLSASFAAVARRARDEQRLDDSFVDHDANRFSLGGAIIHITAHNALHRGDARHILERLGLPDLGDYLPLEWELVTLGL